MPVFSLLAAALLVATPADAASDLPGDRAARSVVLITVDDMSCDSIGAFGCPVPETTPRIDRLAAQSMLFRHAHVQVGNCMPSRNVMMSGLYPHQNGVEGFRPVKPAKARTLVEDLADAGYFTAIRGKASHTTPFHPFPGWRLIDDQPFDETVKNSKLDKKNPASFGNSVRVAARAAKQAGQPLFLNINVSDPHKPFWSDVKSGRDPNVPSKIFTAADITVPGFLTPLFNDPKVRDEVALYYSSVRRADDAVGHILDAIDDEGLGEALVIFLSDHGMPLPFAKTQLYHHSTNTPLLVRWAGRIEAGEDDRHVVSAVDLTPTILDLLGIDVERGFSGRSFAPVLHGQQQDGRDWAVMTYYENSGRNRHPMRTVRTRGWGYLFNPWSDGERNFATATDGTDSYRALGVAAQDNTTARQRKDLMDYRVREELYDYTNDPDALDNLIESQPAKADKLRAILLDWMKANDDPMTAAFEARTDEAIAAYMSTQDELMATFKKRSPRRPDRKPAGKPKRDLFTLDESGIAVGETAVVVSIPHSLAKGKNSGSASLVVTLKDGDGKRLDRQTQRPINPGTAVFTFDRPATESIRVSAFAGPTPEYADSLQHVTTQPVANKPAPADR